ncbi:MAG: hypothetical protein JWM53_3636 [bacterium]|nr:hypothetical protein [bacterium]
MIASWPKRRAVLPALLAGGCVAVGALLALELQWRSLDEVAAVPSRLAAAPRQETASSAFSMPPLGSLREVVDRPLFSESRRPAPAEAPKEPAAKPPNLTLVGVFLSVERRQALIERGQPPRVEWISERQKLDGWTVEAIGPDRIVLVRTDARHEIVVKDRPGKQVAAARQKK